MHPENERKELLCYIKKLEYEYHIVQADYKKAQEQLDHLQYKLNCDNYEDRPIETVPFVPPVRQVELAKVPRRYPVRRYHIHSSK